MKPIPETIPMPLSIHGHGAKGMALYVYRNEEHGVQLHAVRKDRRSGWVETWTSDFLPDREFKTFKDLDAAVQAAPEPIVFTPVVLAVEPKGNGTSRCYTCRGEALHTLRVKTGWRAPDVSLAFACDAHLEATKADPMAAIEARRKWVRENPPLGGPA